MCDYVVFGIERDLNEHSGVSQLSRRILGDMRP